MVARRSTIALVAVLCLVGVALATTPEASEARGARPAAGPTATSVSAGGGLHGCARTSDGAAWCWGSNSEGRLGDGTTTDRTRGVRVTEAGGGVLPEVTAVSAGGDHSCARTRDGNARCWGRNDAGQLGDGTTTDRPRAVRVVATWATAP